MLKTKRIYAPPSGDDGRRVLIDRLWPRGMAKEKAHVDEWLKELAPSTELRTWFGHDPGKWEEFKTRYREELRSHGEILHRLKQEAKQGTVTLVFGAKDEEHNNAVALEEMLEHEG